MLLRRSHLASVTELASEFPVTAILGPRQVGKTTLARAFFEATAGPRHWFDLESERDLARLGDPLAALGDLEGLVVIDEVQLRPDRFPTLRVLATRPGLTNFEA